MNPIFQILKEKNLIKNNWPRIQTINSLDFNEIEKIGSTIDETIKSMDRLTVYGTATHTASSELSGGVNNCSSLSCRSDRINKLSRFALMYSDKVYVESYFSKYPDISFSYDLDFLRETLYNDVMLICEMSSLIEEGFIEFYTTNQEQCFTCQAKNFLGEDVGKNFTKAYKNLQKKYLQNMSVKVSLDYDELEFLYEGPEPYFHHPLSALRMDVPEALRKRPTILRKIASGKQVSLSKTLIKELGYHIDCSHTLVSEAMSGLGSSKSFKTSFLTDNDMHINFLNSLHSNKETIKHNRIAEKHLTSIVPFINDVKLKDILKLRNREEESFLLYRKALNEAIKNFSSSSGVITEKEAKDLYADIIAPSIAQLNIKVKQAKKDLIVNTYRPAIGVVGVISFGLLAGLFPPDMSEIIKALGLFKVGGDAVTNLMALGDKETQIKTDQFYFLWKLKKTIKS